MLGSPTFFSHIEILIPVFCKYSMTVSWRTYWQKIAWEFFTTYLPPHSEFTQCVLSVYRCQVIYLPTFSYSELWLRLRIVKILWSMLETWIPNLLQFGGPNPFKYPNCIIILSVKQHSFFIVGKILILIWTFSHTVTPLI